MIEQDLVCNQSNLTFCSQVEHLIMVIQKLSMARDLETIIDIVKHSARQLTQSDGATFILKEGGNCYYVDEDAIAPLWKGKKFPLEICIGGWTMRNRTPAVIPQVLGDTRIPYEAYEPTFVKSLVAVPIRQLDPIGAIGTYWAQHHEPTEDEIKLLQALADSTAIAMENVQVYQELELRVQDRTEKLEVTNQQLRVEIVQRQQAEEEVRKLSLSDEMTGLYNRRGFIFLGNRELETAKRQKASLGLVFIDLDGLKKVNDNYGHEAGDLMIKDVANLLKTSFRETDIIARLGGDEFVILHEFKEVEDSQFISERLEKCLGQFNDHNKRCYQLSFSIGQVIYTPDCNDYLETLLQKADEAMYIHKKQRKQNRLVS
ncbi:MAG: hypothetical protein N5P05_001917 [Chroococcopsis gigantea SAG 12.99]|jgi:diguanylate cyclase (GGDEF)-like protein|nr:diguanylate cyclase [Chlorogloea purpurea SAG 13.99]MDV3000311.1 hypothetical protein [Chroococcopsis gigantea SAG 12.99]